MYIHSRALDAGGQATRLAGERYLLGGGSEGNELMVLHLGETLGISCVYSTNVR